MTFIIRRHSAAELAYMRTRTWRARRAHRRAMTGLKVALVAAVMLYVALAVLVACYG